jgi:hypothetical protein
MLRKLTGLVITFWVGGLWITGLSASILFDTISDRQLAGNVAGQLFEMVSCIGIASGLLLLMQRFIAFGLPSLKQRYVWIIGAMLLLILVGYFGVQSHLAQLKADAFPVEVMQSDYAKQFAIWHGVSGVIYLMECLLGTALVLISWRE